MKLLLSRGADISAKDQEGKTALKIAEERGHANVAQLLKQAESGVRRDRDSSDFILEGVVHITVSDA